MIKKQQLLVSEGALPGHSTPTCRSVTPTKDFQGPGSPREDGMAHTDQKLHVPKTTTSGVREGIF